MSYCMTFTGEIVPWRGCRRGRRSRCRARRALRASRSAGSRMASAVCSRRISLPAGDSVPPLPAPGSRPISSFSRSSWNSTERGLSGSSAKRSTTRAASGLDGVLAAMGHDAVADLQHHVERAVRRVLARQQAEHAGDVDAAFEPAADLEEAPAGEAVHVLVQQAGEAGELAQDDGHGAGRVVARRDRRRRICGRSSTGRAAPASHRARSGRGSGRRCRRRCRRSRPGRAGSPLRRRCRTVRDSRACRRAAAGPGRRSRPAARDRRAGCGPCLGALDIAAEPDQVLGGAAGQAAREVAREAVALAGQQRLAASTGVGLTTQTSAAWPPRCMASAVASGEAPTRAKPPGITAQPSAVRAR